VKLLIDKQTDRRRVKHNLLRGGNNCVVTKDNGTTWRSNCDSLYHWNRSVADLK